MPLLLDHKYVFIHIPKTGGMSVIKTLPAVFFGERFYINGHSAQHCTYAELKMLNMIPDGFKIFTVCRNPYERFASELAWKFGRAQISQEEQGSFVSNFFYPNPRDPHLNYSIDNHNLPQLHFIKGCLSEATILRFENLAAEFKDLFGADLVRVNQSPDKPQLTDYSKGLVSEFWREDFTHFGYDL